MNERTKEKEKGKLIAVDRCRAESSPGKRARARALRFYSVVRQYVSIARALVALSSATNRQVHTTLAVFPRERVEGTDGRTNGHRRAGGIGAFPSERGNATGETRVTNWTERRHGAPDSNDVSRFREQFRWIGQTGRGISPKFVNDRRRLCGAVGAPI